MQQTRTVRAHSPAEGAAAGAAAGSVAQVQVGELKPGAGLQHLARQGDCIAPRTRLLQLRRLQHT